MNIATINLDEKQLIKQFGRSKATFIAKVHYWIKKGETQKKSLGIVKDGLRWIFNSATEWGEQLTLSARTIQNITSELSSSDIIFISKLARGKKRNTNCVTLNYDELGTLGCIYNTPSSASKIGETGTSYSTPNAPSNTTVQDMFVIWNRIFPENQDTLTKDIGKFLYAAHKNAFNNSLSKWEDYCKVLLIKNQHKITLEAAISFKTISFYTQPKDKEDSDCPLPFPPKEKSLQTTVDDPIVANMLTYWNTSFKGKAETPMTNNLKVLLENALKKNFNNNIEEWKCYCQAILSSTSYIMTENFTLTLPWALKPETIQKVFDKKLGVKEIPLPSIIFQETAQQHIEKMALEEDDFCIHIRHKFIELYGEAIYHHWLKQVGLRVENNQLIIVTDQDFTKNWITTNYYKIFDYVKDTSEHFGHHTSIIPEKEVPHGIDDLNNTLGFFEKIDLDGTDTSEFSNHQPRPQEFKKMMGWDKISYGDDLDKDLDFLNSLEPITQKTYQPDMVNQQSQIDLQEIKIQEKGISTSEAHPLDLKQRPTEVGNKETRNTPLISTKMSLTSQTDCSIPGEEGAFAKGKLNTSVDTKSPLIHTTDVIQKDKNNEEFTTKFLRSHPPLTTQVLRSPYTLETNLQLNNLIKEPAENVNTIAKITSMVQPSPQVKNYNFTQSQEEEKASLEDKNLYPQGIEQTRTKTPDIFQKVSQSTKTITLFGKKPTPHEKISNGNNSTYLNPKTEENKVHFINTRELKTISEQQSMAKILNFEAWIKNIHQDTKRVTIANLEAFCELYDTNEHHSMENVMRTLNSQEGRLGEISFMTKKTALYSNKNRKSYFKDLQTKKNHRYIG